MIRRIVLTLCVCGLAGAAGQALSAAFAKSATVQVAAKSARSGYIVASS